MSDSRKHGALWIDSASTGELVFEQYDDRLDIIGAVHERSPGLFAGCLYRKVKDPGLSTANWTEVRPEALFDNLEEAKDHIAGLFADLRSEWSDPRSSG